MNVEEATKKVPEEAGISRYGEPEEIADLLAFMVSPAAKWMTGTSVRMDGGRHLEKQRRKQWSVGGLLTGSPRAGKHRKKILRTPAYL
jgi:hypothetical protein